MDKKDFKELRELPIEDISNIVFSNFYSEEKREKLQESMLEKKAAFSNEYNIIKKSFNAVGELNEYTDPIGGCPEYEHLIYNDMEEADSTTLFIDMVNFTKRSLHTKDNVEELKKLVVMKKKFINSCIMIVGIFGGHVHDISGDGIMAYFHRGEQHEQVNDAILAGILMIDSVKNYLNPNLKEIDSNHKDIKVRVGVDTGKVIWTKMGNKRHIESCETKAVGFSVDIAAKLSGGKEAWQLKIGEATYNLGNEDFKELAKVRYDDFDGTIDYKKVTYKRYIFDWQQYIKRFNNRNDFVNSKLPLTGFPITLSNNNIPSVNRLVKNHKEVTFG